MFFLSASNNYYIQVLLKLLGSKKKGSIFAFEIEKMLFSKCNFKIKEEDHCKPKLKFERILLGNLV